MHYYVNLPPHCTSRAVVVRQARSADMLLPEWTTYFPGRPSSEPLPFDEEEEHESEPHVTEIGVNTPGLTLAMRTLPVDFAPVLRNLASDRLLDVSAPTPVLMPRAADPLRAARRAADDHTQLVLRMRRNWP